MTPVSINNNRPLWKLSVKVTCTEFDHRQFEKDELQSTYV
jgi:hypothetical protein